MAREKKLLKDFLEAYKFLPCLWDTSDKLYSNKKARNQAYEILTEKFKAIDADATVELIKKRLENMRCTYKREYKKVVASRVQGTEEEYQPTLWYYKYLLFLDEKDDSEVSVDKTEDSSGEEDTTPIYIGLPKKRRRSSNGSSAYFISKEEESESGPADSNTHHDSFNTGFDETESYGRTVGLQLKKLDDMQRNIAEKLISDVVYYARLNQLNTMTTISLNEDFSG